MAAIRWMMVALLAALFSGQALAQGSGAVQVVRQDRTDLPGNDIGDMVAPARSFDDCAQRCVADGRCGAFTYNLNNRNCIPKSSAGNPERNDRAVSGIVNRGGPGHGGGYRPGPGPGGDAGSVTRYDATDLPGADVEAARPARSFDYCAQRCLADARCAAFTFNLNNSNCVIKSVALAPERNDRAVSGIVNRSGGPGVTTQGANNCSVGPVAGCGGCSASCPPSRRPVCEPATEGFNGGTCLREASCRCER